MANPKRKGLCGKSSVGTTCATTAGRSSNDTATLLFQTPSAADTDRVALAVQLQQGIFASRLPAAAILFCVGAILFAISIIKARRNQTKLGEASPASSRLQPIYTICLWLSIALVLASTLATTTTADALSFMSTEGVPYAVIVGKTDQVLQWISCVLSIMFAMGATYMTASLRGDTEIMDSSAFDSSAFDSSAFSRGGKAKLPSGFV
jgi:hypothetical protein